MPRSLSPSLIFLLLAGLLLLSLGSMLLSGCIARLQQPYPRLSQAAVLFLCAMPGALLGMVAVSTGSPDLGTGNLLGGNLCYLLLAIPLAILICPLRQPVPQQRSLVLSLCLLSTALFCAALDIHLSTMEGLLLVGIGLLFIAALTALASAHPDTRLILRWQTND